MPIESFLKYGTGGFLFLLTLIQITPIKINPWSSLIKWFGKTFNSSLMQRLDTLESKMDKIEKNVDETNTKAARMRVLAFGDELTNGIIHSKGYYEHILNDIDEYERYCLHHPDFKNNITCLTVETIKTDYKRRFIDKFIKSE